MRSTGLLLALLLLGESALCAEPAPPEVALVVLPGPGTNLVLVRKLRRQILRAFRSERGVKLSDPLNPKKVPSEQSRRSLATLEHARKELRAKRYREASRELQSAVDAIRDNLSDLSKSVLSEATLELAAAQLGAGRRSQALPTLVELLVWRPGHPLVLDDPPTGWGRLLEQARAALSARGTGSVQVSTVPAQAEAFVDGRRLGPTPVLAADLREGTHYLSFRLEGYEGTVVPFEVRRGEQAASFPLTESPHALAITARLVAVVTSLGEPTLAAEDLTEEEVGASRALFVIVRDRGSTLELRSFLYHLGSGRRLAQVALTVRSPLETGQLGPLALWRLAAGRQLDPRPPIRRPDKPWYRRWWVWTLAGVVAVASVSIPLGLRSRLSSSREQFQLRW